MNHLVHATACLVTLGLTAQDVSSYKDLSTGSAPGVRKRTTARLVPIASPMLALS